MRQKTVSMSMVLLVPLLLAACGVTPTVPVPTTNLQPTAVTTTTPVSTPTPTNTPIVITQGPDACKILTVAMIKTHLGIDVDAGLPKQNFVEGSMCSFKHGLATIVDLQIGKGKYYQPGFWPDTLPLVGIGDQGFYQDPSSGNFNAEATKGDTFVHLFVYSRTPYTGAQVKAAMKAIVDQL